MNLKTQLYVEVNTANSALMHSRSPSSTSLSHWSFLTNIAKISSHNKWKLQWIVTFIQRLHCRQRRRTLPLIIPKQAQGLGRPRKPCGKAATAASRPNSYLPSSGIIHRDSKGSLWPRNKLDHNAMIKFPWTAKKMKNNTLVFTVDAKAHKPEIKHFAKASWHWQGWSQRPDLGGREPRRHALQWPLTMVPWCCRQN